VNFQCSESALNDDVSGPVSMIAPACGDEGGGAVFGKQGGSGGWQSGFGARQANGRRGQGGAHTDGDNFDLAIRDRVTVDAFVLAVERRFIAG